MPKEYELMKLSNMVSKKLQCSACGRFEFYTWEENDHWEYECSECGNIMLNRHELNSLSGNGKI